MKAEKQFLLDEIKEKIEEFESFIVMRYESLNAKNAKEFRREIAKLGGDYEVVRKRVLCKAAGEVGVELTPEDLKGHIGVVFAKEDPAAASKTLIEFSKEKGDVFEPLAGRIDGMLCNAQDVKKIAQLPGKNAMRAELLGLFEAPMAQMLATVEALLTSIMHCLENKVNQSK
jgi:large subunit ribosomal protein L10